MTSTLNTNKPLTVDDVPLLKEGDVLRHTMEGQFVFSGRVKLSNGPARLEVRALGMPNAGWRTISFPAFTFISRPEPRRTMAARTERADDNAAYRRDMIDAGRGHLLR